MATYCSKGNRLENYTVPAKAVKCVSGSAGGAGLSPAIWDDCPLLAAKMDPFIGYGIEDDFMDLGLSGTLTSIISNAGTGRYLVFGGAGSTIVPAATAGGGIQLTLTDSDQATSITTKQTPFQITSGAGDLWFEARFLTSTVTTNEQAFFIGLMDSTAQTATVPLTATGALADINLVGFHKPEANTAAFDASYKANTVTAVEVNANIGTMVADTYLKVGMRYRTANNELSFYVNGVKQTTSKTIPNATGTDFPADVMLAPVCATLAATSDTEYLTLNWWKCYQLRA